MRTVQIDAKNSSLHTYAHPMRQAARQGSQQSSAAPVNKVREMASGGYRKPLYAYICEALADAFNASGQIFASDSRAISNRMCKNYGHNIDKNSWKRGLPCCMDCGATVSDASQLRKAISR